MNRFISVWPSRWGLGPYWVRVRVCFRFVFVMHQWRIQRRFASPPPFYISGKNEMIWFHIISFSWDKISKANPHTFIQSLPEILSPTLCTLHFSTAYFHKSHGHHCFGALSGHVLYMHNLRRIGPKCKTMK